jgi:hypothetical protein
MHEIRALRKLRKLAFAPKHASGADDILTANSGGIALYRLTA